MVNASVMQEDQWVAAMLTGDLDEADSLGQRLAKDYVALGPVYRQVARIVERDQTVMGMSVGIRAVLDLLPCEHHLMSRVGGGITGQHIDATLDVLTNMRAAA